MKQSGVDIRSASYQDADEGSDVLRRSIAQLCHADHHGNADGIAGWLANKAPDRWRSWVDQTDTALYVAIDKGRIAGVGMCSHAGEIMLNYVSPDARYRGVSKAILARMEDDLRGAGIAACSLESTRTARQFYLSRGYRPADGGDDPAIVMTKDLLA